MNLLHVNNFKCKQRFKYEDVRVAMLLLEKGTICAHLTLSQVIIM